MFDSSKISDYLQNKNFIMCITSVFFMLGILAFFSEKEIIVAVSLTVVLILFLFLKIFSFKRALLLIFVFYIGFFTAYLKIKNYDELVSYAPINSEFTGRIISIPNTSASGKIRFYLDIDKIGKESVHGKSLVTINSDSDYLKKLNIGQMIKFKGNLRKPFVSTNPSQFDYSAYLRNYSVFTVIYTDNSSFEVSNSDMSLKWKFLNILNTTRNRVLKTHSKYLKSPNLEILGGIVFGDDAVAPPEYIKNSFINSGLLHILAASGMNVAFIFLFWNCILKFFRIPFRIRVLSGMLMVILYTLMTGLGPSVVRASLMLLFVLAGKLIDRDTHSVSLLSFVAVLMLIYNPANINDVGFQLSFLVTFGLITTAKILSEKISVFPEPVKMAILVPFVAQIWIAPVQMFYFNTISLYSVFANIISAPILCVISFCGFLSSLLAIIPKIADFVCSCFDFINNFMLDILVIISNSVSNFSNCLIQTTHPDIIQLVVYYIMLLSVTFLIKHNKFKYAIFTTVFISFLLVITTFSPISKNLEIIAFDVQNADCFLIKTPENKYFFVDTGKAPYNSGNSQAKIIMLKYLKDRGIKNIEGVIVTHFDNDHSGGTSDIILNSKVKNLYLNTNKPETETAKNIFKNAHNINQKIIYPKNNENIYSETDLILKTFIANIKGKDSSNGCSIITLLSYKDFDILFMGDAGIKSFEQVARNIPHNIEVLKVGHHGGVDVVDDNMLKHINNKISLISTGVNTFGHPNKGTLDILRNTVILRTDYLNSIMISSDGKNYDIYSYNRHAKKYILKNSFLSNK